MNKQENGNNRVSVPAALAEQLNNLTTKGGDSMQFAPGPMPPGPAPRPVNQDRHSRADD